MATFFSKYPKLLVNNLLVTDIIARVNIREKYSDKLSIFYPYSLQEGDTPEIIAEKYYGDAEKHWIVLLANDIIDPFFEFPFDYPTFERYLNEKYKAYAENFQLWKIVGWRGQWQSWNTYEVNQGVYLDNTAYLCIKEVTTEGILLTDSKYWQKFLAGKDYRFTWGPAVTYYKNDVVEYQDNIYICLQDNVYNQSLSNSDYWTTYSTGYEYAQITTNINPPGYRAVLTTTDTISGESTTEKIWIDEKSFHDEYVYPSGANSSDMSDEINSRFNYADMTTQVGNIEFTQTREKVTIYDYEMELNEGKREIQLIREEYASQLDKELKLLMRKQYV